VGTSREDQYTFLTISCWILLRMKNINDKICRENQNTHFTFSEFLKNCAIYEIIYKNMVEPDRPQIIVWHMRIACWISKSTDTHSIMLTAFPLQQWLHEHAWMFQCTYITCFWQYNCYMWYIWNISVKIYSLILCLMLTFQGFHVFKVIYNYFC